MATLPDVSSLGPLSSGQGKGGDPNYATPTFARPIEPVDPIRVSKVEYVPTDNARGIHALGEGAQSLANAGLRIMGREKEKQDNLDNARNVSNYTSARIALDSEVNNTFDINKLRSEYPQKYGEMRDKIAESIIDPYQKEMFLVHTEDDLARGKAALDKRISDISRDTEIGSLISSSDNLHKDFVKVNNEDDRQIVFNRMNTMITAAENKGIITHEQGEKFRNTWTTTAVEGWYKNQPADVVVRELGGLRGALMHRESGGNPTLQNQFGFSGLYQFGAPRLKDLGVYVPGSGEPLNNRNDLRNWNQSGKDAPGKWSGQFNIPGFPEVKTIKDFLGNTAAQNAVFDLHTAKMDEEIKKNGLEKYIGTNVGGIPITKEGIYAMAHLGGMGGAKAALEGNDVRNDANGTSVISYARLGMSQGRFSDILSPERKIELYNAKSNELIAGTQQQQLSIRVAENQKREIASDATNDYMQKVINKDTGNILVDLNADPRLDATQKYHIKQIIEREANDPKQTEARTYGSGYYDAMKSVSSGQLTTFDEVLKLGVEGQLTSQGVHQINAYITGMKKDANTAGVLATKQSFMREAKTQLSFEDASMPFLKDPVGEGIFNTVFVPTFERQFDEWVQAGKNPYDFLQKEKIMGMVKGLRDSDEMRKAKLSASNTLMNENAAPAQANKSADTMLPPPPQVNGDNWQKIVLTRPNKADGTPEGVFAWSSGLKKLVEYRSQPAVRVAFNKRFPGANADEILLQLGVQ